MIPEWLQVNWAGPEPVQLHLILSFQTLSSSTSTSQVSLRLSFEYVTLIPVAFWIPLIQFSSSCGSVCPVPAPLIYPPPFVFYAQLNSNNPWTQPSPAQLWLPLPWTPASAQLSSAQLGSIPHAAHSSSNPTPFYFDNKQIVCIKSQSQHVWKKSRSCPKHPCGRN